MGPTFFKSTLLKFVAFMLPYSAVVVETDGQALKRLVAMVTFEHEYNAALAHLPLVNHPAHYLFRDYVLALRCGSHHGFESEVVDLT